MEVVREPFLVLCKALKKWGIEASFPFSYVCDKYGKETREEVQADIPWLTGRDFTNFFQDEVGYFLFDTKEECYQHYEQIKGDDDSRNVYAATVSPEGLWMSENT